MSQSGRPLPRLALAATLARLGLATRFTPPPRAHASSTTTLSDGFDQGNSWTYWSNGCNASQTLVTYPVHGGGWALQAKAGPDASQGEIGLADIKSFTFTEAHSQLSFWYYAAGDETYKNLTVEAYTASGDHFFTTLPRSVTTGQWTKGQIMFADLSPQLVGATITQFVIKPVITPTSGTAVFTLDDVQIANGVMPPPQLTATAPANAASTVSVDGVLTAFFNEDLDPHTVSSSTVQLVIQRGTAVSAAVRYEAGQRAIAVVPAGNLPPGETYRVRIASVTSASGAPVAEPATWSFSTGAPINAVETAFADDFSRNDGWIWWSDAATSSQQLVANPTHGTAQALQASASDSTTPFALSQIRPTTWLDENSSIGFWYHLSGSAVLRDLVLMLTTASGQILSRTLNTDSAPTGTWTYVHTRIADMAPGLVGMVIRHMEIKVETATPGSLDFVLDQLRVTNDLGRFAALPATTPLEPHHPLAPPDRDWVNRLAHQVMASQQPDGSIVVGPGTGDNNRVGAYFSNYAVLGLLHAYELTHTQQYLGASNAWLQWYQSYMNPDGTVDDFIGTHPSYTDTHDYDSADSYTSTYLLAVWKDATLQHGAQQGRYIAATYPFVQRAYDALDSVFLADGLTIAKQSYPIEYPMDNTETWLGLVASQKLATLAGDTTQAKLSTHLAMRTLYALHLRFWLPDQGYYACTSFPDGSTQGTMQTWYPDALSNVLLLSVVGQPTQQDRALFDRLVIQFDGSDEANRPTAIDDTSQYTWWAMAALRVGEPQAAAYFVQEYVSVEGRKNPDPLAFTAGNLIRIRSYDWNNTLWF